MGIVWGRNFARGKVSDGNCEDGSFLEEIIAVGIDQGKVVHSIHETVLNI